MGSMKIVLRLLVWQWGRLQKDGFLVEALQEIIKFQPKGIIPFGGQVAKLVKMFRGIAGVDGQDVEIVTQCRIIEGFIEFRLQEITLSGFLDSFLDETLRASYHANKNYFGVAHEDSTWFPVQQLHLVTSDQDVCLTIQVTMSLITFLQYGSKTSMSSRISLSGVMTRKRGRQSCMFSASITAFTMQPMMLPAVTDTVW